MQKLLREKKGSATDILYLLIMVFFLSISFVIVLFANDKIQNIISTTELNSTSAYDSINDSFSYINDYVVQRGFTLFFAILCIGILISSFLVRTHPIFIFLYILTLGVAIFVSIYLANAYALVVENAQLAELASNYAMMTFVMSNIGKILLGVAGISFVILFGKLGGGGNPSDDL